MYSMDSSSNMENLKLYYLICIYYILSMVSNKCCVPGCQQSSSSKFGVPQNDHNAWGKKLVLF